MIQFDVVETARYIVAIGNKVKSGKFPYLAVENTKDGWSIVEISGPKSISGRQYEIMAHYPKGSALTISGVPLLPGPDRVNPVAFIQQYSSIDDNDNIVWVGEYKYEKKQ